MSILSKKNKNSRVKKVVMMKQLTRIKGFLILIMFFSLFSVLFVSVGSGGLYGKEMVHLFTGRIIYIQDSEIEVKKRSTEITLYLSENTEVIRGEEKIGQDALEVCQKVRVYYTKEKDRNATKIVILKESNCKGAQNK